MVKNPPAKVGDVTDAGLIPGSGRSPGEGHGNPFLYSWLENPMNRGAWGAAVHRVAKSQTWLKKLSMHTEDIWYAFILGRQLGMAVGGNLKFDGLVFWILVVRCLEQSQMILASYGLFRWPFIKVTGSGWLLSPLKYISTQKYSYSNICWMNGVYHLF